jgi:trypsin-like peptidase
MPGAAPEGLWGFQDQVNSEVITPREAGIVPILVNEDGYRPIGTAFFITDMGVFVTAKHVVDSFDIQRLVVWQFLPNNQYYPRPVFQVTCHETCDLAVGVLVQAIDPERHELVINNKMMLTTVPPSIGDYVATFAYPNTVIEPTDVGQRLHFNPNFYEGRLEEYLPNGSILLRGPCYRSSMVIHHGASGGPVASTSGRVFAVNSTGMDGANISHVSRIDEILSITINDGRRGKPVSIAELAHEGEVTFDPPPNSLVRLSTI